MLEGFWSPGTLLALGYLLQIVPSMVAMYKNRDRGFVMVRELPVIDDLAFGCEFILSFWLMAYMVASRPFFDLPYSVTLPSWALSAGFGLYVIASAVNGLSRTSLGKNWIRGIGVHDEQTLNHTGLYKHVRNPMYASYWLMALGIAGTGQLATVGVAVVIAICYSLRIPGEEKMLRERFGSRYLCYKAQTGRFFPRLRRQRHA